MAYVIFCEVFGLKYYLQKYRGVVTLNGLVNNAIQYNGRMMAEKDAKIFGRQMGRDFQVMQAKKEN